MHTSSNDKREYRYTKLNNALSVLLISDSTVSRSAAALSVKVGHFSDPVERQGLAHFLEHMLFLGTEKYPQIGEFQEYVNRHGGKNNAWTGTENTTYFFDIQHAYFPQALDRFGQFFICPSFDANAVDKERNAIESEYQLKINDDVRRIYQVKKECINPEHPFAKFSVGNHLTLADNKKQSIRDDLVHFYKNHYSANLMTACLLSNISLDELEALANEIFSGIANLNLAVDEPQVAFVDAAQKMQFIQIEPIKELRKLSLSFSLPQNPENYKNKPISYIAHLLGDEGTGSLLSLLKEKNWVNHLSAGSGITGSTFSEFVVSLDLTQSGLHHVDEIVSYVFQTLALIKKNGLEQWRFDEMQHLRETAFHHKEFAQPLDTVSHLVMNMQYYSQQDVLYGDFMMQNFDQKQILHTMSYLTPENMCLTLVAKGGEYNKKANWYFTPYSTKPFSQAQLEKWQKNEICSLLILPKPNPFICKALSVLALKTPLQQKPQKILDNASLRLWHLQENEFHSPKGIIYIAIDSPEAVASVADIVKTHLCVEMLMDVVNEMAYPAEIAGLNYNIYTNQGGVTLKLSGFTPKLPLLLDLIIEKFMQRSFDENRFLNIKTQLLKSWNNALKEKPIARLYNSMLGLLQSNNPSFESLIQALEPIERDELAIFVTKLLSRIYIEIFVYGNWHEEQSLAIAKQIEKALYIEGQVHQETQRQIWQLDGEGTVRFEKNCQSNDSAIVVYYQSSAKDFQQVAFYSFAHHLMSAVFFNALRTKRQLGYMVGSTYRAFNNFPGIIFYVQSPLVGPKKLLEAIDDFLNAFFLVLLELNEKQWLNSKQGILAKIREPDTSLRSRGQRFWASIASEDHEFDKRENIAKEIEKMTKDQMIRFVVEKLKPRKADRLILHSCSPLHSNEALF